MALEVESKENAPRENQLAKDTGSPKTRNVLKDITNEGSVRAKTPRSRLKHKVSDIEYKSGEAIIQDDNYDLTALKYPNFTYQVMSPTDPLDWVEDMDYRLE